jgi:hypothetical protein
MRVGFANLRKDALILNVSLFADVWVKKWFIFGCDMNLRGLGKHVQVPVQEIG